MQDRATAWITIIVAIDGLSLPPPPAAAAAAASSYTRFCRFSSSFGVALELSVDRFHPFPFCLQCHTLHATHCTSQVTPPLQPCPERCHPSFSENRISLKPPHEVEEVMVKNKNEQLQQQRADAEAQEHKCARISSTIIQIKRHITTMLRYGAGNSNHAPAAAPG